MSKSKGAKALNIDAEEELVLLAENIKIARKRRKITFAEMAKRSGISVSTLSRLESGDPAVSIGCLLQVLSVLHLVRGLSEFAAAENDKRQTIIETREKTVNGRVKVGRSFDMDALDF